MVNRRNRPAAQRPSLPAAQRPSLPAAQRPSLPAAQHPSLPAAQAVPAGGSSARLRRGARCRRSSSGSDAAAAIPPPDANPDCRRTPDRERGDLALAQFAGGEEHALGLLVTLRVSCRFVFAEFSPQPGADHRPLPLDRPLRHAEHLGHFFDGQPAEETQFTILACRGSSSASLTSESSSANTSSLRWEPPMSRSSSVTRCRPPAAFGRLVRSGVIDQDPPHRLGTDREEMGSALASPPASGRSASGRPRVPAPSAAACGLLRFPREVLHRQPAQLVVGHLEELIDRHVIAAAGLFEDLRCLRPD